MKIIMCSFLTIIIIIAASNKKTYRVKSVNQQKTIENLEKEKAEIFYNYTVDRYKNLKSLYGKDHKYTKEAELQSKIAQKDLEIAKIKEYEIN